MKIICSNKKAYYNYEIMETLEAGISLLGTEVKSLRTSQSSLKESLIKIDKGEVFLFNCHIHPYGFAHQQNHEPTRTRKLLLHRSEIKRLMAKVLERGWTLVPIKLYFKNSKAKIELGLGKGKKLYDKREDIKKKEHQREINRAVKERR